MGSPVRFPFGVTTAAKDSFLGQYGLPSPLAHHEYFDDFNSFTAAEWTITRVGTTPTEAIADGAFGLLRISTVASAASSSFLQKLGASFVLAAGKKAWFGTRLQVSVAADVAFAVGLQSVDTTPLDVTDGIYFLKAGAATTVDLVCRKDATTGSTSKTAVATVADATNLALAWYYDGVRTIKIFVNGANTANLDLTAAPTAFLPDAGLRVSFGAANVGSTARTADYDYLFAAIER